MAQAQGPGFKPQYHKKKKKKKKKEIWKHRQNLTAKKVGYLQARR
jgi:hypothetical protein